MDNPNEYQHARPMSCDETPLTADARPKYRWPEPGTPELGEVFKYLDELGIAGRRDKHVEDTAPPARALVVLLQHFEQAEDQEARSAVLHVLVLFASLCRELALANISNDAAYAALCEQARR